MLPIVFVNPKYLTNPSGNYFKIIYPNPTIPPTFPYPNSYNHHAIIVYLLMYSSTLVVINWGHINSFYILPYYNPTLTSNHWFDHFTTNYFYLQVQKLLRTHYPTERLEETSLNKCMTAIVFIPVLITQLVMPFHVLYMHSHLYIFQLNGEYFYIGKGHGKVLYSISISALHFHQTHLDMGTYL